MNIKEEIQKLRDLYDDYLKKHPNNSNETILNKFLLLIKKDETYELEDYALDMEAYNFKQLFSKPKIETIQSHFPDTKTFVEDIDLAKIYSSGEQLSDVSIKIKDFNDDIKSFIAVSPISWIVGGVVNNKEGSKNDIDILISTPTRAELEKIIMFRIARMVSPEIRERISFLPESKHSYVGPFTNNLPLFRLTVERIPNAEIEKMAEAAKVKLKIKSEEVNKRTQEANDAIKNDKITPGEYYKPQKPVRSFNPGEPQTIQSFLDIYDKYYSFPSLSSKKLDGERLLISKINDKITIYSEDGTKIENLNNLKQQLLKLPPEIFVIEGELESWNFDKNTHNPRESVDTGIKDDNYVLNIFDVLYFKGEIDNKLYDEINIDDSGIKKWREEYL